MNVRTFLMIPLILFVLGSRGHAVDKSSPEGFVSLFNGKDLSGWKVPVGDNGHWKVVDGVIDYDAGSEASGDKALWSEGEYKDFVLELDWRLKEAPFINKNVPYILPDGTHAKDIHGKEIRLALPDADSGVYLRGDGFFQVNMWCWPIGSGEMYSVRMDRKTPPDVRAAVTPKTQADKPIGEWNHFVITAKGKTVKVVLNGVTVIPGATIPNIPERGRLALQHHGGKNKAGQWTGPPSLVQFKNISIKELPSATAADLGQTNTQDKPVKGLLIVGGHDHETSFYSLFDGYKELGRLPVADSAIAFQTDLRKKYDVLILYDFTRSLDEKSKKNLQDYIKSGKGLVVLHHALLDYPDWAWWAEEVVGGRYRLKREGSTPSSTVKNDQPMSVKPTGNHPILGGVPPFKVVDETYKGMFISHRVQPLLTTDNAYSDPVVAWVGPCSTSRVVAIQLGHGPTIFRSPEYRTIVHNAVLWSAGRLK